MRTLGCDTGNSKMQVLGRGKGATQKTPEPQSLGTGDYTS